jgi:hypothetical protein
MPPPSALPDEGDRLARAFTVDCERPNSLAQLARYETSIERSIDRCLRQLKTFQAARAASIQNPGPEHNPGPQPPAPGPGAPSDIEQAVPPAETVAIPSKTANYHSNPKMGVSPNPAPPPYSS